MQAGFLPVFRGQDLCLQLLLVMTHCPWSGHMAKMKGSPEITSMSSYQHV